MPDFLHLATVKIISIAASLFLFFGVGVFHSVPTGIGQNTKEKVTLHRGSEGSSMAPSQKPQRGLEKEQKTFKKLVATSSPKTPLVAVVPPEVIKNTVILQKEAPTAEAPILASVQTPVPLLPTMFLNQKAREATVNIFCMTKGGEPLSGSGVIISPQGIILTNAHVAQYLLLKNYTVKNFIECSARTGSPAQNAYTIELLYLPPVWIEKNSQSIRLDSPHGTGENDFALLRITGSTIQNSLPQEFPFIAPETNEGDLQKDTFTLLASYPAGFLGNNSLTQDLWLSTGVSQIIQTFTFRETPPSTPDLFSVQGTIEAQEGSSGGAIVNFRDGKLLGLITTRTDGKTTNERTLRALSMSYINEALKNYTGESLEVFLSSTDLEQKATQFQKEIAPRLAAMLTQVLDK